MKTEIPDDIDALKTMVHQQQVLLKQLQAQMCRYEGQVAGYEREIERLKSQLDKLKRMLFGQSSEKLRNKLEKKIREAEKRLDEMEGRQHTAKGGLEAVAAVTAESAETGVVPEGSAEKPVTPRPSSRKPLPPTLPRETVRIEPAEKVCPVCAGELAALGETVSDQLDIINNAFRVIETVRPKLACRKCDAIVQAPLPAKLLDRSYASPGLLARILVSKYVEHTPLYRQSEIYARHGLELSRNTMVRWVQALAEKLSPLADALNRYILSAGKVHTDDTTVPVQAPGNGKTRTARLWVYVRDDRNAGASMPPAVWFTYFHLQRRSGLRQSVGINQRVTYLVFTEPCKAVLRGWHPPVTQGKAQRRFQPVQLRPRPPVAVGLFAQAIDAAADAERQQVNQYRHRPVNQHGKVLLPAFWQSRHPTVLHPVEARHGAVGFCTGGGMVQQRAALLAHARTQHAPRPRRGHFGQQGMHQQRQRHLRVGGQCCLLRQCPLSGQAAQQCRAVALGLGFRHRLFVTVLPVNNVTRPLST